MTGRRPGASGHFDLRVRSSRKMASEWVTASLALGAINRSVSAMAEVEHLTRLLCPC
jgi:hypothetical protein